MVGLVAAKAFRKALSPCKRFFRRFNLLKGCLIPQTLLLLLLLLLPTNTTNTDTAAAAAAAAATTPVLRVACTGHLLYFFR